MVVAEVAEDTIAQAALEDQVVEDQVVAEQMRVLLVLMELMD